MWRFATGAVACLLLAANSFLMVLGLGCLGRVRVPWTSHTCSMLRKCCMGHVFRSHAKRANLRRETLSQKLVRRSLNLWSYAGTQYSDRSWQSLKKTFPRTSVRRMCARHSPIHPVWCHIFVHALVPYVRIHWRQDSSFVGKMSKMCRSCKPQKRSKNDVLNSNISSQGREEGRFRSFCICSVWRLVQHACPEHVARGGLSASSGRPRTKPTSRQFEFHVVTITCKNNTGITLLGV